MRKLTRIIQVVPPYSLRVAPAVFARIAVITCPTMGATYPQESGVLHEPRRRSSPKGPRHHSPVQADRDLEGNVLRERRYRRALQQHFGELGRHDGDQRLVCWKRPGNGGTAVIPYEAFGGASNGAPPRRRGTRSTRQYTRSSIFNGLVRFVAPSRRPRRARPTAAPISSL